MKIKLGATYKDVVTGFVGVATGYVQYMTGCNQALLVPKYKKGDKDTSRWYDEQRLTQVGRKVIKVDNGVSPGFDAEPPRDQSDGERGSDERQ